MASGVCGLLIVFALGTSRPDEQSVQVPDVPTSEPQPAHPQHTAGEAEIQILGRRFTESEIARGREVYAQYCAACHGVNAEGQFPDAPLEPDTTGRIGAPPHDVTGHTWHHSDVVLIRYIVEGGFSDPNRFYPMPPFGNILSEEDTLNVLAYIKSLWTDEQRVMQRELTEEEQRMFGE